LVDGRPTAAHWIGGKVEADPELLRRAEVVVALAEEAWAGDTCVRASLSGSATSACLAFMRAFSRVTSVEIVAGRPQGEEG
jgi:hypothetical protein